MSVQLAEGITLEGYDALKNEDVNSLEDTFTSYLLEELERTDEMALGNPVAGYLSTAILRCQGEDAGFLALDAGRYSVEVIGAVPRSWARHPGPGGDQPALPSDAGTQDASLTWR